MEKNPTRTIFYSGIIVSGKGWRIPTRVECGATLYFCSPLENQVTTNNSRLAGLCSYSCFIKNTYLRSVCIHTCACMLREKEDAGYAYTQVYACSVERRILGVFYCSLPYSFQIRFLTEPEASCLSPTGCSVSAQAMPIYLQVLDLWDISSHAQLSPQLLQIQTQAFLLAQQVLYPLIHIHSLGSLFLDHNLEKKFT